MSIYHIWGLTIGAGIAITAALTNTSEQLLPLATLICGGIFGNMTQTQTLNRTEKNITLTEK